MIHVFIPSSVSFNSNSCTLFLFLFQNLSKLGLHMLGRYYLCPQDALRVLLPLYEPILTIPCLVQQGYHPRSPAAASYPRILNSALTVQLLSLWSKLRLWHLKNHLKRTQLWLWSPQHSALHLLGLDSVSSVRGGMLMLGSLCAGSRSSTLLDATLVNSFTYSFGVIGECWIIRLSPESHQLISFSLKESCLPWSAIYSNPLHLKHSNLDLPFLFEVEGWSSCLTVTLGLLD